MKLDWFEREGRGPTRGRKSRKQRLILALELSATETDPSEPTTIYYTTPIVLLYGSLHKFTLHIIKTQCLYFFSLYREIERGKKILF